MTYLLLEDFYFFGASIFCASTQHRATTNIWSGYAWVPSLRKAGHETSYWRYRPLLSLAQTLISYYSRSTKPLLSLKDNTSIGLAFFLVLTTGILNAQEIDSSKNSFSHRVIPIAFYKPETSVGLGVMGIASFRFPKESKETRSSHFAYGAAYTFNKQILIFLPFDLLCNNEDYRMKGELRYFRYYYHFYGLGRGSDLQDKERYDVNFPRFRAVLYRRIFDQNYFGIGYRFDAFNLHKYKENGILDSENILGIRGGMISNVIFSLIRDTRDHLQDPKKGLYFELTYEQGWSALGADYEYHKIKLDARNYNQISDRFILAGHIVLSTVSEDAPFFVFPYVASATLGRGYSGRRYSDHSLLNLQYELRYRFSKRIGLVTFVSTSFISPNTKKIFSITPIFTGGVGGRYYIDPLQLTKLRFDLGYSVEGFNFYITVNEAF